MEKVLEYLDEGYEWIVDLDIEKYFDTVNHDKLISILRERINDATTLHLIPQLPARGGHGGWAVQYNGRGGAAGRSTVTDTEQRVS